MIVKEEFIKFIPTFDTIEKGLASLILESLHSFGIETM